MKITLLSWALASLVTVTMDMIMIYRRLSGKLGDVPRMRLLLTADNLGGLRGFLIKETLVAILMPPAVLAACAVNYLRDR